MLASRVKEPTVGYSPDEKSRYQALVFDEFRRISTTFEKVSDFDIFCGEVDDFLSNPESMSISSGQFSSAIEALKELTNSFDMYAGEGVIEAKRFFREEKSPGPWRKINIFTPSAATIVLPENDTPEARAKAEAKTKELAIAEAKAEWRRIIIEEITRQNAWYKKKTEKQKANYIKDQRDRKLEAEVTAIFASLGKLPEHPAPAPSQAPSGRRYSAAPCHLFFQDEVSATMAATAVTARARFSPDGR